MGDCSVVNNAYIPVPLNVNHVFGKFVIIYNFGASCPIATNDTALDSGKKGLRKKIKPPLKKATPLKLRRRVSLER